MKAIGTVLLVLVAIMGMTAPVLGADAGSSANAGSDATIAWQDTDAWAGNGWEYAEAGTDGYAIIGITASSSGATSDGTSASADTGGVSAGIIAASGSDAYAYDDDPSGDTDADATSGASGWVVAASSYAGSTTYPESWAGADASVILGVAWSDAEAEAYI